LPDKIKTPYNLNNMLYGVLKLQLDLGFS
jgi:hypothetical protein